MVGPTPARTFRVWLRLSSLLAVPHCHAHCTGTLAAMNAQDPEAERRSRVNEARQLHFKGNKVHGPAYHAYHLQSCSNRPEGKACEPESESVWAKELGVVQFNYTGQDLINRGLDPADLRSSPSRVYTRPVITTLCRYCKSRPASGLDRCADPPPGTHPAKPCSPQHPAPAPTGQQAQRSRVTAARCSKVAKSGSRKSSRKRVSLVRVTCVQMG